MNKIIFLKFLLSISILYSGGFAKELITPIPLEVQYDREKAILGKKLFQDTILSSDNTISCESCHNLDYGGADNKEVSIGVKGRSGDINAPTVFNSVFNISQFWDGRSKDLKEQVFSPIHNPVEMDSSYDEVVSKISSIKEYRKAFYKLYKDGVTIDNIADAIAEFEKALITPNSNFDQFLRGDSNALSQKEKKGYKLFKSLGCIACHNGVNIGGNLYQKIGVFDTFEDTKNLGRFNVTKDEADKFFFKVPSLRNISKTAPYFHNGKTQTLKEAITKMTHYQLGREISLEKRELIYHFLLTLDGEKPKIIDEK